MITCTLEDIDRAAQYRKPSHKSECLKRGKLSLDGLSLEFTDEDHAYIRTHFALEPELPSALEMATNAAAAVARTVANIAAGRAVGVSDDVYDKRVATCKACDQFRHSDGRCAACGCWIILAKAKLASEPCPLSKWPDI